ncbi:hypothetical protein [Mangrovimonas sp. YM274]|uniref:hypothetical protein n=1 Tax=Mangrovimonas sp. YM274 TaxID=3070660 RepID=UPI0027DAC9D8|nr:hypothetical protein [Mangrovimonas sp. YM274]WMI68185.1 hypothetical protein RBH95_13650 [Mangrovimonas sp. YM274]
MLLNIDVKTYLKYPLKNGFELNSYTDHGMAENCRLTYPILSLDIWRDRTDYSATIIYDENYFNVIHLANFINGNLKYLSMKPTGTEHVDARQYLTLINEIFEKEFDKILDFLFQLTDSKKEEFNAYFNGKNKKW